MNTQTSSDNILNLAIEALSSNTDLRIEILDDAPTAEGGSNRTPDALLRLLEADVVIPIEIKRNLQPANLGALIDQINRLPGPQPGLLVADYINPRMAERLEEAGVQFLDTAGNAYINRHPVYVLITGKKQTRIIDSPDLSQTNRAFEPKGLLVTFAFLEDPSLAAKPYRDIALVSGVAVGTVGWVINALKAGQYLQVDAKTRKRRITNYDRLLDRWVSAWPEKLKHKYLLGQFTPKDPHWWEHTRIQNYGGYWGGETAAAIYTKHLKPQVVTAYVDRENLAKLIRDARLSKAKEHRQAEDALVYLYSPFWPVGSSKEHSDSHRQELKEEAPGYPSAKEEPAEGLAPPIIVYADLIATGDPRNLETAQLIRDEYITGPDRTA